MGNVEQSSFPDVDHSDHANANRVLLATLTALVLASGSLFIWHTRRAGSKTDVNKDDRNENKPPGLLASALTTLHLAGALPHSPAEEMLEASNEKAAEEEPKNSRSKERRRRGKDPLKALTKGGRKGKSLLKQIDSKPMKTSSHGDFDSNNGGYAVEVVPRIIEPASSSQTGSVAASTSSRSSSVSADRLSDGNSHLSLETVAETRGQEDNIIVDEPHPTVSVSASAPTFDILSEQPPLRTSQSSSDVQLASLAQNTSDDTPPPESLSTDTKTTLHTSQSMPAYSFDPDNNDSSAWDSNTLSVLTPTGSSSNTGNETTYRKPPRFRSKSRAPGSGPGSPMVASASYNPPPFSSFPPSTMLPPLVTPPMSTLPSEVSVPSFTYPSLNNPPSSPSDQLLSPSSSSNLPSRRIPTPRRTPTPTRTTTPPAGTAAALSAQTQIASLRGALEAARMREEKYRQDLERLTKEYEMLKWRWTEDTVAWQRKEIDYQSQIHYMQQNFQIFFNQRAPAASSSHPPSPALHSPPASGFTQYRHAAGSPQASSPSVSTFGGYPGSPSPANLFSLIFPGTHVPRSGTSSAGSSSPAMDSSPLQNRGRTRTRSGTDNEGWVVTGEEEQGEQEEVSDVLADAILRRPESMRTRSGKAVERSSPTFTFPSISNIGNVEQELKEANINENDQSEESHEEGVCDDNTSTETETGHADERQSKWTGA